MDEPQEALPAPSQHPIPADIPDAGTWRLQIDGLVAHPRSLTAEALRRLPRLEHQGSFTCERGWEEGRQRWQGAALAAALALAEPFPAAGALYAIAGDFRSLVPLEAISGAILADALDGQPLTVERGAPCRLVVPDLSSQLSMKWVERLELVVRPPDQAPGPRKPEGA